MSTNTGCSLASSSQPAGGLNRHYAPMAKSLGSICSSYSEEELALIVAFLERAADAGTTAAAETRESLPGS